MLGNRKKELSNERPERVGGRLAVGLCRDSTSQSSKADDFMTRDYSDRRRFSDFDAAKSFAQSLATKATRHKITRDGPLWVVDFDSPTGGIAASINSGDYENCELLRDEITKLRRTLEGSKSRLIELKIAHEELKLRRQSEEDEGISERIESGIQHFKNHYEELSKKLSIERAQLADARAALARSQRSMESSEEKYRLLGEALTKAVGPFRFDVRREEDGKQICRRCAGDGGLNQGCPTCDGTGLEKNYKYITELALD